MDLKVGDIAPDFELKNQDGKTQKLSDYKGKWVLVYFYPKDFTPGCTTEARRIRDNYAQFQQSEIAVLGISTDTSESHKRFQEMHNLPFSLLADTDKKVVNQYGVYGPKKFLGKAYEGTHRISFLIDPMGRIEKIYESVKPAEHAAQILNDFRELKKSA